VTANQEDSGGYALAAAMFAVCALALAWPWLSGRATIPWDAKAHFYPQFVFLAHALRDGEAPFWNPHVFAGMPQIADPQSLIFAPVFPIAAALVPEPSFVLADGLVFAMLAMGGLALIAFFRDRGWSAPGALVAALAFAFGGSAAWRIQHVGQIMSLSWLPVTLFLLARALDRRSILYGAGAGVAAACLVLGRDQVAFLCVLLLAAYAVSRVAGEIRPIKAAAAPLLAGGLCGAAIIAVPLALTLDLSANSNRPAIDLAGAFKGSLPPGSFLTLISANLFGTDGPLKDFWGPPSAAFGTKDIYLARNMTNVYIGELPLVALLAAFGRRFFADRDARFFAAAAALLTLYALGRYTPAFEIFYHVPGVDLWRRPADATFPLCALLAILSGYAVHLIVAGAVEPRLSRLVVPVAGLFALAAGVALAFGRLAQAAAALSASATFAVLAAMLLRSAPRLFRTRPAALLAAIGALFAADFAVSNGPNESTALPPEQFDVLRVDTRNGTIALLREKLAAAAAPDRRDRVELAAIGFHWPNATLVHGLDHDLGYNPVRLKIFEEATGAGDHLALPEQRQFSKLYPRYRSPLSNLLGLRFVATGVPIEQIDTSYKAGDFDFVARTKDAYVYENRNALPRALVATCAMRVDFSKMIESGEWPQVDFTETVLLEQSPICHRRDPNEPPSTARIVSYEKTRVEIEANAPRGGGWIVLGDVWHPGWEATLDGEPTPVLRANVLFRALPIPEGRHVARFEFRPLRGLARFPTERKRSID
jgi:hypothetical protein